MTRVTKVLVFAWAAVLLFLIFAIPNPPVHKVNNSCCSANECSTQHHHERTVGDTLTTEQMKIFFDNLNADYYFDQLPKDVQIEWGDLTKQGWMGVTRSVNGQFVITIDRSTHPTPNGTRMTIIHESCHVKTWAEDLDHGSKFQNCTVNLATHGAFEGIW